MAEQRGPQAKGDFRFCQETLRDVASVRAQGQTRVLSVPDSSPKKPRKQQDHLIEDQKFSDFQQAMEIFHDAIPYITARISMAVALTNLQ